MADGPRFTFQPLERRGLLLGLDAAQLLTILAGGVVAVFAHAVIGGPTGVLAGLVFAGAGLAAALWVKDGVPLGARLINGMAWVLRGSFRARTDDSPMAGRVVWIAQRSPFTRPRPARPGVTGRHVTGLRSPVQRLNGPPGIELIDHAGLPGEGSLGVVRDHRAGTWAGVIPVRGCSFSLLDPADQAGLLDGWRQVLASLARPGTPVARVQWVQRTWTGPDVPEVRLHSDDRAGASTPGASTPGAATPGVSTAETARLPLLADRGGPSMVRHQSWLVVAVRPAQRQLSQGRLSRRQLRSGGSTDRAVIDLRRELRLLGGQLRDAALDPLPPLDLPRLADMLAAGDPPASDAPWPLASADRWSVYRADGAWHVTYWIAEWPRVPVGPEFLTPLLVGSERVAVSVVMAPVAPDRAMREVRSARTADLADAELRSRAGFLQSARRERESEGAARREAELADGHHEFRFSGYVTVSADDPEQLTAACAATEHTAQSARVELRRLFGRQAEAYTWTLPLARGLR